jgi:hypothetical protein
MRSMLGARIVFNNQCSTIECTIRDFSSAGAKLLVSSAVPFPQEFDLVVPKKGRAYRARLVWRGPEACGVCFVRHPEP